MMIAENFDYAKGLDIPYFKRYQEWKDVVRVSGPRGLRRIKGFHDESLAGEWQGHRSSRLNEQYRVIYRVDRDRILVEVVDVNAHDYGRR
ncbi:MAG: type II toxin-antitoxin system mRNA interferase toxin, RelE/StbE family [Spirochaetes bacterium]|jgi:plasmid maintenance system killer protein|nr:type II toxin-antitoxin system mRNA interferase toxin, RelE/StbE family [Spirochaetota bacterium]